MEELISVKNVKKTLVNKYIVLLIVLMIFSMLYSLFNDLKAERLNNVVGSNLESFKYSFTRSINSNMEIFENNPKNYIATIEKPINSGGVYMMPQNEVQVTYSVLSYHKSWLLNRILLIIMGRGQVYMNFMGILLATVIYSGNGSLKHDKAVSTKNIIKDQVLMMFIITIVVLVIGIILGLILGNVMYTGSLNETEQMKYLNDLYETKNIWMPNISYTVISILGTILYLITYTFVGFFIGHILKDRVLALLIMFLTANLWFSYALTLPITPLYFLHRVVSKFIFIPGGYLITISNFQYYYILILAIFMVLMAWLAHKLLNRRLVQ